MGVSTVGSIVLHVLKVIWKIIQPLHMPTPTVEQFRKISRDFYLRWGFPNCSGAVDDRHMKCKKPNKSKKLFYCWKGFYSVKLQAVVDANYRFIFAEAGDYGSTHDSTTLIHSAFFEELVKGNIKLPDDDKLPGSEVVLPHCFICDGAFKLMQNFMKPYRGRTLSQMEKNFNKRLSRARVVVECAFGHLVQKFRIFFKTMEQSPENAALITRVCCLLVNVIIDLEGFLYSDIESDEELQLLSSHLPGDDFEDDETNIFDFGKEVRHDFAKYFMEH